MSIVNDLWRALRNGARSETLHSCLLLEEIATSVYILFGSSGSLGCSCCSGWFDSSDCSGSFGCSGGSCDEAAAAAAAASIAALSSSMSQTKGRTRSGHRVTTGHSHEECDGVANRGAGLFAWVKVDGDQKFGRHADRDALKTCPGDKIRSDTQVVD